METVDQYESDGKPSNPGLPSQVSEYNTVSEKVAKNFKQKYYFLYF